MFSIDSINSPDKVSAYQRYLELRKARAPYAPEEGGGGKGGHVTDHMTTTACLASGTIITLYSPVRGYLLNILCWDPHPLFALYLLPREPQPPHRLPLGRLPLGQRGAALRDDLLQEPVEPSHVEHQGQRGAGHPDRCAPRYKVVASFADK